MKHKYTVLRDVERQQLVIKEYAELDKEIFSLLCEERYPEEALHTAMAAGTDVLITAFRTRNFYPTYVFANRIAEAIAALLKQSGAEPVEVVIDDSEFLSRQRPDPPARHVVPDEEAEDIDDLLDDPVDEEFDDIDIDKINTGIKIADDDHADIDEEP